MVQVIELGSPAFLFTIIIVFHGEIIHLPDILYEALTADDIALI